MGRTGESVQGFSQRAVSAVASGRLGLLLPLGQGSGSGDSTSALLQQRQSVQTGLSGLQSPDDCWAWACSVSSETHDQQPEEQAAN